MAADKGSSLSASDAVYRCEDDPGSTGWVRWTVENKSRFNGQFGDLLTRRVGDSAIVRMQPHHGLGNIAGHVHGGAVMTFVDMAMFIGCNVLERWSTAVGGLTVDCNVQFVGGADLTRPIDVLVEITRETGQFLFVRGTVQQQGDMIASFMGLLRKQSR